MSKKEKIVRIPEDRPPTGSVDIQDLGDLPLHMRVDVECDEAVVGIGRARGGAGEGKGARLIAHLKGRGDVAMSTDEIMALTRGC